MAHVVDFFKDAEGNAPVEAYLDSLTKEQRAKLLGAIKKLEEHGSTLPFPFSSQVEGKLRELRTKFGKTRLRILYYGDANQVFQLLHGITKNTSKLELSDIKTGSDRMTWHQQRLKAKAKVNKSEPRRKGEWPMATRFSRYFDRQMEDVEMRDLVAKELEELEVGIQIAKLREREDLNQTQLAARAGMNASKISRIENSASNVTLSTLSRIAFALNQRVKISFEPVIARKHAVTIAHKRSSS
jgi:phage-related protein/DNA-binding Xre family transcriptional regulator